MGTGTRPATGPEACSRRWDWRRGSTTSRSRCPAENSSGSPWARALVGRPHIVLADEPSGNLDRGNGEALLDLMWDMSRRHGQAFVVVTHDEDLGRRADRAFRLEDGLLNAVAA